MATMQTSIFLAGSIGPVMIAVGLAARFNQRGFRELAQEFVGSRAPIFLSGLIILPAGIAPRFVMARGRAMVQRPRMPLIAGGAWTAAGLLFCLFGYLH